MMMKNDIFYSNFLRSLIPFASRKRIHIHNKLINMNNIYHKYTKQTISANCCYCLFNKQQRLCDKIQTENYTIMFLL